MRYYTSDLHFRHARIIELCNRPFRDVDEMSEAMIDGINSTLDPAHDDLVILGDICMGNMEQSLKDLGRIRAKSVMMVPGNHDRWSLAYHTKGDHVSKRKAWQARYEAALNMKRGDALALTDRRPSQWRARIQDVNATMSHFPWSGDSRDEERYKELRPTHREGFLICGHVHGAWQTSGRQFNVGVDANGFKPVSEIVLRDWIANLMNGREMTGDEKQLAREDLVRPRFPRQVLVSS
jgi:calcineurin-like phosphoesterase family protein